LFPGLLYGVGEEALNAVVELLPVAKLLYVREFPLAHLVPEFEFHDTG
jgi:hypothetical protein